MKTNSTHRYLLTHIAASLLSVSIVFTTPTCWADTPDNQSARGVTNINQQAIQDPKIQLAILLDTSSSMDGLIDQARNQLWRVVDEFSKATRDQTPVVLEVAVFEYGNDSLDSESGYIRKVTDLTSDLDRVSEALFSLTTNGGNEYCGHAIMSAAEQLSWSRSDNDIKTIFIAGNEPFTQGRVTYKQAISAAKSAGIIVNTIHAGSYEEGLQTGWRDGAHLAGGDYMSIDHNHKIAHISAPQDQRIAELNNDLNKTYIPYGSHGEAGKQRQLKQDSNTSIISPALLSKRAKSKAGNLYNNSRWDLVDAIQKDKLQLETLDESALPSSMRDMDQKQRQVYISEMSDKRLSIKKEIADLSKLREQYIVEQKRKSATTDVATMNDALVSSVRKQGKEKNYRFSTE